MNIEQAKAMALEMQRKAVFRVMLWNYGSGRKIVEWDDFIFSLSTFCAWHYKKEGIRSDQVRKWLNKLASAGVITRDQYRTHVPARYRFPREVCDQIAAGAIAYYQALGYSQDEIRQKVATDEDGEKHE